MIPAQRSCRSDAPPSCFRHVKIWPSPSRSLDPVWILGFQVMQEEPGKMLDLVVSRHEGLSAVVAVGSTARQPDGGEKLCDGFRNQAPEPDGEKHAAAENRCDQVPLLADRTLNPQRQQAHVQPHVHVARDSRQDRAAHLYEVSNRWQPPFHRLSASRVASPDSSGTLGTNVWARNSPVSSVMQI